MDDAAQIIQAAVRDRQRFEAWQESLRVQNEERREWRKRWRQVYRQKAAAQARICCPNCAERKRPKWLFCPYCGCDLSL